MKQATGTEALARVRQMRQSATEAERLIWNAVRSRRLGGFKFRRQVWIGSYIADFPCPEAWLVSNSTVRNTLKRRIMTRGGMQAWPKQAIGRCISGTMTLLGIWTGCWKPFFMRARRTCPHPPTASRRAPPSP